MKLIIDGIPSVDNLSRSVRDINTVRREVLAAISEWQRVSTLYFQEVSPAADADIKISFARGDHRDGYPFDGNGRVLAHAFPPGGGSGGDVHLDDDEHWTAKLYGDPLTNLVSLRSILLHEIGHSLGLAHSYDDNSIMYAFYQHSLPPELSFSDIRSIQTLYGKKKYYSDKYRPRTITTTTTSPALERPLITKQWYFDNLFPRYTTASPPFPDLCHTKIDAITKVRGEFFIFKDRWLWRYRSNGELRSGPTLVSRYWRELPERIDGAIENRRDLMFFAGNKCYIYDGHQLVSVKLLVDFGLPSYVRKVRLVYSWNYWPDEPIYIWTDGDEYWKFDKKSGKVELGYPRKISAVWHNVPKDASAAATLNNDLFFFSPTKAVKFYSLNMTASEPIPIVQLWRNCHEPLGMYSDAQRSQYSLFLCIFVTALFFYRYFVL